ncbi:MAG: hypothetical protein ACK4K0_08180 [Flavobacteriales bacterium]
MNQIYSRLNLLKWSLILLAFTASLLLITSCNMGKYYFKKRIKVGNAELKWSPKEAQSKLNQLAEKEAN